MKYHLNIHLSSHRLHKYLYPILLMLFIAVITPLSAQNGNVKFEHLSLEDGLSHIYARQIIQDKSGFIWIATPDGLNKYDGYQFTRYRHDPFDSTSLAANSTNCIFVDSGGTLWVGSFDALHRYNPAEDNFTRYQPKKNDRSSLISRYVAAITEDNEGTIWIGTSAGLAALTLENRAAGKFLRYPGRRGGLGGPNANNITELARDVRPGSNAIWIGTSRGGLNKLDLDSGIFSQLVPQSPNYRSWYEQYGAAVLPYVDSLITAKTSLAMLQGDQDTTLFNSSFSIDKAQQVLIYALGEGAREMVDYGWISNADNSENIWEMELAKTLSAGGHPYNRIQLSVRELPAGEYNLYYQTDLGHRLGNWNKRPPKREERWGIQVIPLEENEVARLSALTKTRFQHDYIYNQRILTVYPDPTPDASGNYTLWVSTEVGLNQIILPQLPETPAAFPRDFLRYYEVENIRVNLYRPDTNDPYSLKGGWINTIYRSTFGGSENLWIGEGSNGLAKLTFDQGKARFTFFNNDPSNPHSLSSNTVTSIIEDHSGNLWIGSGQGINKMSRRKLAFKHFTHSIDPNRKASSLPHRNVYSIYEDSEGIAWIGTAKPGLSRFDPLRGKFTHFAATGDPAGAPYACINAITESPVEKNIIWLGTRGTGLSKLDKSSGHFTHFPPEWDDPDGLQMQNINSLFADRNGYVWIGTSGKGIVRFDTRSGKSRHYRQTVPAQGNLFSEDGPMTNEIWTIRAGKDTTHRYIWVGVVGGGLSKFDTVTEKFTHFPGDLKHPGALNSKSVTTLLQSADDVLWVGTYSGGISRFQPETGTFKAYTTREGLPNNMVQGILEDAHGKLWISTNSGLSCFDPVNETFQNYNVNDGLQSNQFNREVAAKGTLGKMYFAGINGFTCFHPDSLRENAVEPPVLITDFKIFDKSDQQLWREDGTIQLSYEENFFSFEFVALDYTNSLKNEYAYQLLGFDNDWVYSGARRYASYTNLDPGEYTFRVKAANSDATWNETGASINIEIAPPFWQTWWFYLLAIVSVISVIVLIHNYRVGVKVEQMRQIERVRKKAAADFHDELGHKLTKISLFSELIRRSYDSVSPENLDYLNRISDISGNLYNGMRDFLWTLDPSKDSLYEVMIRLKDFGDEFFDKTGISFQVQGISRKSLGDISLTMDWKRHIILMFKEAMNNILKHSDCRNVMLDVSLEDNFLRIVLRDDGIGFFPAEMQGANRPAKSAGVSALSSQEVAAAPVAVKVQKTTGLGIKNMKERARKLNADFTILSSNGHKGTTVIFSGLLPENG